MYDSNVEMTILIKGRPITEFTHRGQIWVEGRGGSEYEIEVKNKAGGRVEAVISVDGLSIMDGKAAGATSSGYLLNGYETLRIPGWKVDSGVAAKFAFGGKHSGYSTEMSGGDTRNTGIIGIMVFSEKYRAPVYTPSYHSIGGGLSRGLGAYPFGAMSNNVVHDGHVVTNSVGSNSAYGGYTKGIAAGAQLSASASTGHPNATKSSKRYGAIRASGAESFEMEEQSFDKQNLGTVFGDATNFATVEVSFERADMISMMVLRYDDSRGLKARGIVMVRPSKVKYQTEPEAFPAMNTGCKPPPNWRR